MAVSPASQVYSPQILGDAVVLGSGLAPLTVLRQERASQARAAANAARLKQQQDAAAARDVVPLNANGWLPHAKELSDMVAAGYEQQKKIYADPKLSPYEKRQQSFQIQSGLKQAEDKSNELKAKYTEAAALASDPRYNKAKLQENLLNTFQEVDPITQQKRSIPLAQYDTQRMEQEKLNPANFNQDEVLQKFIKQEADAENERLGKGSRPGGFSTMDVASSNIFEIKNGKVVTNADNSPHIRDMGALLQRAQSDPFMNAIMRGNAFKAQQDAGAATMAAGGPQDYAQLTPEQRMGLAALPLAQNAKQIGVADLVSPYARLKTSHTDTYNRVPQVSSTSGKEKYTVSDPNQGGFGRVGLSTSRDGAMHANGTQTNRSTAGMSSAWRGLPPTRTSASTGKPEPYTRDNVNFKSMFIQQPGSDAVLESNNLTSQNMQFGAITHVLTTRSGNLIRATSEADNATPEALEAWYKRARAEYPDAKSSWVVESTPKKGVNSYANEADAYKDMVTANEDATTPKTSAELRAKAHKLVAEQNATYFIPYEGDNARQLNSYTKNFYEQGRATREAFMRNYDARTAPGRSAAPAAKAVTGPMSLVQPAAADPGKTTTSATTTGTSRFRKKI